MAYIAPNTWITLCSNVPLDNSYDHQLTFASVSAQRSYFLSKKVVELSANSYQRVMSNKLRIACTMAQAVQCNYLYFSNDSFENKWFYAFITGWEYINNVTTEITYEIDVFQSFWFDVDLKPCFVEREHSNTDNIGENLVEEGLATGDYILGGYSTDPYAENVNVVFWCTFPCSYDDQTDTWTFESAPVIYFQNRCYNGLYPVSFPCNTGGATKAAHWLATMPATYYQGIVSASLIPQASIVYESQGLDAYFHDISKSQHFALLQRSDGQPIKNKKLFTSPYTELYVTCFNGVNATYAYEHFNTPNYPDTCEFNIIGDVSPDPSQCIIPLYYKGVNINADEMLTLSGFPQISWSTDTFKAWLAQNASNIASVAIGLAGAVATGGATLATAAAPVHPYAHRPGSHANFSDIANQKLNLGDTLSDMGSSISPISGITSLLVGGIMAWNTPAQARGNNGKYLMHKAILDHFGFYNKHIKPEYVTIIDDYFNMFGYATRRVKIPNITGRPYWNYVKTQGIVLDIANAPQPYIQKMIDCFNRGITFWHNPANVGRYDLNNSPVTTP